MRIDWDEAVYVLITAVVILFIAWLLFAPAPGHDPLVTFRHAGLVA